MDQFHKRSFCNFVLTRLVETRKEEIEVVGQQFCSGDYVVASGSFITCLALIAPDPKVTIIATSVRKQTETTLVHCNNSDKHNTVTIPLSLFNQFS